ncbi:hypothetical protein HNY73_014105 [Argiope bruennichi]|uniref:Uncharacterized protein n=1 Tax=Argiope bruennichi TaxID=94029 RepID=A0A8T0EPK1_ARGBR|nr:hypothetical protein HNY73_014105 [Argiope bruennichi]
MLLLIRLCEIGNACSLKSKIRIHYLNLYENNFPSLHQRILCSSLRLGGRFACISSIIQQLVEQPPIEALFLKKRGEETTVFCVPCALDPFFLPTKEISDPSFGSQGGVAFAAGRSSRGYPR